MNRIIILLIVAMLPMILAAQPTEVAAKKIRATEKLQLSNKTLTAIVESITVLSTHAQSPTAKAVYDLTAAMITSVSTNATLSGNGTVGDPLGIAQQSATSGQVLKWNGSAWLPAADDNTIQTLSYSAPNLTLSSGGGSVAIPQGDITGTGAGLQLAYFTAAKVLASSSSINVNSGATRLGIGTASPIRPLDISFAGIAAKFGTDPGVIQIGDDNVSAYLGGYFAAGGASTIYFGQNSYYTGGFQKPVPAANSAFMMLQNGGFYFYPHTGMIGGLPDTYRFGMNENGYISFGNRAINTAHRFRIYGISGGSENMITLSTPDAGMSTGDEHRILFTQQDITLGQIGGRWDGATYNFFIDGYNGGVNRVATFLGNGRVGIGTQTPAQVLHVAGAARITGSAGIGTSVMLRDANGDISNATLGTGLSITSGTLNASGTVGGTGTSGKVAYWSGTNTLTSTTNFPFDGTSLAVGRSTAGAGRFNVTGNSTSVGLQVDAGTLPSFGVTAQLRGSNATTNQSIYGIDAEGSTVGTSSNYLNKFFNTGTGSTIMQLGTPTTGGNVAVQYNITGGGSVWSTGVINSDSDKFKIEPNTSLGDAATGLTITTAGLFGINNQNPGASLDMDATTDGIALSSGNTANRPASGLRWLRYNSNMAGLETRTSSSNWHVLNSSNSVTLGAGAALGTAPTITVNNGSEMAYTVSLTVGTAPTANAVIFTRTFPNTWSVAPTVVFSAANQVTASEITKFYVDTQTTGQYTIMVNGTLSTPQTYKLNIILRN